jgi:uncharacterized membrane protein
MPNSPIVFIHICGAVVGLLSAYLAMVFRKGSGWHGAAGTVFFVSMLAMSSSAAYGALFIKPVKINFIVACLTFYLVTTAWRAAKRRDGGTDAFDLIATLFIIADGIFAVALGFSGSHDGGPPAMYVAFGTIALLCGASDVRMFLRGGLAGARRIARHLWRMCLALLLATLSFFPGQARNLPPAMRQMSFVYLPHILLVAAMVFWMIRVSLRKRVRQSA